MEKTAFTSTLNVRVGTESRGRDCPSDSVINVMKQLSCQHGSARLRQVVHYSLGDVMRRSGLNCTSENSFR